MLRTFSLLIYTCSLVRVFVGAQSSSQIPACAQTCFGNSLGSCGPADIACICGSSEIIKNVVCCTQETCSSTDALTTLEFAKSLCSTSGISIDTTPECSNSVQSSALAPVVTSIAAVASSALNVLPESYLSLASLPSESASITSRSTSGVAAGPSSAGGAASTYSPTPGDGQGSTTQDNITSKTGLSTGAKAAIGVVIPLVFIALLALIFFLLRRRKSRRQAESQQMGGDYAVARGPHEHDSGLMVADDKQPTIQAVNEKPELDGVNIAPPAFAAASYSPIPYHQNHAYEADSRTTSPASQIPQSTSYQYPIQQTHASNDNITAAPFAASELNNNTTTNNTNNNVNQYPHPQELPNQNDWSQRHELGIHSRAMSTYSDSNTLAGTEQDEKDEYLKGLMAKKAQVAEERERLRRMEMLREEDERLDREIEEYERRRGIIP